MRYLLDTNILSELIRNPHGDLEDRIRQVDREQVCTSIIVAAELRYGAWKKQSVRLSQRVEELLKTVEVLPFEEPADTVYAQVRTRLERAGKLMGTNDLLIAAHALALGHTLVSGNEREFSRVPGLRLENWLRRN